MACASFAAGGCVAEAAPAANERAALQTRAEGEQHDDARSGAQHDQIVLDMHVDGSRLLGRVEPMPIDADPDRAMVLRASGPRAASLDGLRVLDARFVAGTVVTLGADHVLRAHVGAGDVALDVDAYGPLAVARDQVAYVRGRPPLLELARADVTRRTSRTLTQDMAPAWSPAITQDGRTIVFVSGASGTPRLHRVDEDGRVRRLDGVTRFPTTPRVPRFEGRALVLEDELGAAWVDIDEARVVRAEDRR